MRLTKKLKKIFWGQAPKPPRPNRETGYYWVQWSYYSQLETPIWKIAHYYAPYRHWTVPGETRFFSDSDFIEVYEVRISRIVIPRWWTLFFLWASVFLFLWSMFPFVLDLYNIITTGKR